MSNSNSNSNKKSPDSLATAVVAFEAELRHFEETVAELNRVSVNSDKTLHRAKNALEACSESEQRLACLLRDFVTAMQAAQAKQQLCMDAALQGARRIQARNEARNALLERVAQLGERAREVNEPIAALMVEGGAPTGAAELLASLQEVGTRMDSVIADCTAVAASAREDEWTDIARDADTLKQQLQAARNKVLVTQRNVASRAPS
jgi:exonuclease VII small subunit